MTYVVEAPAGAPAVDVDPLSVRLSASEVVGLIDCAKWRRGSFSWKPATMKKLLAKGLVEKVPNRYGGEAHALTEAGLQRLLIESPSAEIAK